MTTILSSNPTDQRRTTRNRNRHTVFSIFTTVCFIAIILTYTFNTNTFISFSFTSTVFTNQITRHKPILLVKQLIIQKLKNNLPEFDFFKPNPEFETLANEFFKECKTRFFMTWISSIKPFGERELLAVEALFKSNPGSCLLILSNSYQDSDHRFLILKPVINLGFRVQVIEPDLNFLFENTPAKTWFDNIQTGITDPGEIPLSQNLSNLIRLAVLYKYGGVYLDTDFIPLNDFSGLRNSIGAQSVDQFGNWTRLNNAVMIFDKNHPLLYEFIEEFALTFNGNRWGYNGPYLVSRVVERRGRESESNFSVLPPQAFYPVGWTRISGLFGRPVDVGQRRWVEAKVVQLKESSYGVHLWNKQSGSLVIEEDSIIARLISDYCVVCNYFNKTRTLDTSV